MVKAERLKELEFRYFRMKPEERSKLLDRLRTLLEEIHSIVFAYVHGSFVELESFRDVDVAVWVEDPENAFQYAVDLSTELEMDLRVPVDLHVLNEAPLPFRHHVYKRGTLLLSRNEGLRLKELDEDLRQYFDLRGCLRAIPRD